MTVTQLAIENLTRAQHHKLAKLIKSKDDWKLACDDSDPIRVYGTNPVCITFHGAVIVDDIGQVLDIIGGDSDGKDS